MLRQTSSQLTAQASTLGSRSLSGRWVADQVERFGGYLERASGDQLLRDAEDFARRRPWMVAGIGLVAGLAASRFLKASSERRYGSSGSTGASRQILLLDADTGGGAYEPAATARRRPGG